MRPVPDTRLPSFVAIFGWAVIASAQCPPFFDPATDLVAGDLPQSVAVGDLNGDGRADLVTANTRSNDISVILAQPTGGFGAAVRIPVGQAPVTAAVADLDGDGKLDVAVTCYYDGAVKILLGNGDGTFRSPNVYTIASSGLLYVLAADINGDGRADLIVGNNVNNTIAALIGNGDGTFQPGMTMSAGSNVVGLAIGDVNRDGKQDIVAANFFDNAVGLFLGHGDGSFDPMRTLPVGVHPYSVALGDLDADGKPDVVAVNSGAGTISVLRGNGDATFQPGATFAVSNNPICVLIADVNLDGRPDLVIGDDLAGGIRVLLGQPSGGFSGPHPFGLGDAASISSADFDRDGLPDIATANQNGRVSVYLNDSRLRVTAQPQNYTTAGGGLATFSVGASGVAALSYQWRRIGVGPLSDDGNVSGARSATLVIQPAAIFPSGTIFECTITSECGSVRSDPASLLVNGCPADFNLDGNIDPDDLADFITVYFETESCP